MWPAVVALPFVAGIAVTFEAASSRATPQAAVATPTAPSVPSAASSPIVTIYLRDCAVCHAADGRGSDRGPSLVGVGRASLQYYLTTGRMPLSAPKKVPTRHRPRYSPATINALINYVWTLTGRGGIDVPHVDLAHANRAAGGELYRLNCAACHSWAGTGGALSTRIAPSIAPATTQQIADAVRVGPGFMPRFGTAAISDKELSDVVAAARYASHPNDHGGYGLAHIGPLAEGAVAVFVGLGLLLFFTLWIGTRKT